MSDDARVRELERQVKLLRGLLHASSAGTMMDAVEMSGTKRLKRARKRLLLACHPDKCENLTRKELSERFTREVHAILKV